MTDYRDTDGWRVTLLQNPSKDDIGFGPMSFALARIKAYQLLDGLGPDAGISMDMARRRFFVRASMEREST